MKTKFFILSTLVLCACSASAQAWSLDSCINYAVEHNITVKLQQLSTSEAELAVTEARSRYLPTLSAGAQQSWNIGRGLTAENTYANRNTSNFGYSAQLGVPLFSGLSTTRQVAYAKANLAQITEQYEAAKEDISINVITAYLQVLYNKELCETAAHQVALSEYELSRRQALAEAGKIPEIDVLDARSQLESDRMNLTQASNDVTLSLLDLAQLLQLPDLEGFDIQPIDDLAHMIIPAEEAYQRALQYNHSIRAARLGISSAERSIDVARSGYLPTLSFNAGLSSSYYKVSGFDNESFGRQMRNNYSTYFGFSLNIPIFDAFSTRNSVRRAHINKDNARLQLDQAEQQLFRSIQQAYYQALGAEKKLESARAAEIAAGAAFDAMREKYDLGRATPSDYEQAKAKALTATAQRIQAEYELAIRSRLLRFYSEPH